MVAFALAVGIPLFGFLVAFFYARKKLPEVSARRTAGWTPPPPKPLPPWVNLVGLLYFVGLGGWQLSLRHYWNAAVAFVFMVFSVARAVRHLRARPQAD